MERPPKLTLDKSNYITVKVYLYLMTPNCSEISELQDSRIKQSAKNNPDSIISGLSIKVENGNNESVQDMQNMVMEEMHESIYQDYKLKQIISSINQEQILNTEPKGVPKTQMIQIAEYIMTNNKDGMIGIIDYNEIESILI